MNAYINFGEILLICSQDIEQKRNYDRWNDRITDGQNDGQPKSNIAFSKRGYNQLYVYFYNLNYLKAQINVLTR